MNYLFPKLYQPNGVSPFVRVNKVKVLSWGHRSYSSAYNHDHNHVFDDSWPTKNDPTPYDIFNIIAPYKVDKVRLKKTYHRYVKLYHPDTSKSRNILRSKYENNTSLLSVEEKLVRFKLISHAYDLLHDNKKRALYDCTRAGWVKNSVSNVKSQTFTSSSTTTGNYANSHGYHSNSTYAYWNAGTWDDVNNLKQREHAKFNIWSFSVFVVALFICIKGLTLLSQLEETLTMKTHTQEETENDLVLSYTNYGLDTDKISRLRRFLWFRTFGRYSSSPTDLDREVKRNNEMLDNMEKK